MAIFRYNSTMQSLQPMRTANLAVLQQGNIARDLLPYKVPPNKLSPCMGSGKLSVF